MFSLFPKDCVNQAALIPALNQMAKELKEQPFNEAGICAFLSNVYIHYASQGKRDEFFKKIRLMIHHHKNPVHSKELGVFFKELYEQKQEEDICWLKNKKCIDALSCFSNDQIKLTENINRIIGYLKKYKRNMYAHVTLGDMHSFVIEQSEKNGQYTYFVYDPNNPSVSKPLSTTEEIVSEINAIIKRIQLSEHALYAYLSSNTDILLTLYIYPGEAVEEKDELIQRLQQKIERDIQLLEEEKKPNCDLILISPKEKFKLACIPDDSKAAYALYGNQLLYIEKLSNFYCSVAEVEDEQIALLTKNLKLEPMKLDSGIKAKCLIEFLSPDQLQVLTSILKIKSAPTQLFDLYDAKLSLIKYSKNKIARGVLLSNLLTLPNLLDEEKEIKVELDKHLLSSHLLQKDYKEVPCYTYSKDDGNRTLLHEVTRLGDLRMVQQLLKTSDPLLNNYLKVCPLECAMIEGSERIVREMLNYMHAENEKSPVKRYLIDYDEFCNKAFNCSLRYMSRMSRNIDDPPEIHDAVALSSFLLEGYKRVEMHQKTLHEKAKPKVML